MRVRLAVERSQIYSKSLSYCLELVGREATREAVTLDAGGIGH